MQVKQVHESIKLKENKACEGSHCNGDRSCKNKKIHATLGKGILKLETTLMQALKS